MRKLLLSLLLLGFACFTNVFSQVCDYTISPATHHNWVDVVAGVRSPCTGFGCDTTIKRGSEKLEIKAEDLGGGEQIAWRTYIKFDFFKDSKPNCRPKSANLYLNFTGNSIDSHQNNGGNNDFIIRRIVEPWGPDTLRWQVKPAANNYRVPRTTENAKRFVPGTKVGDEDFKFTITDFLTFWYTYPDSNFGFEISLLNESPGRSLTFASSKHPNPSIRPKIELTFDNCPNINANAGTDIEICKGERAELQGNYGEFFKWDSDPTLSNLYISNPTASPNTTTSYTLETTIGSCVTYDTVKVIVHGYPTLSVGNNQTICEGDSVQLSATTNATNVTWTPNKGLSDNTSASPFAFPGETTVYTVTADNGNKCTVSKNVTVNVRALPKTDAGESTKICKGESAILIASGADSYVWDPLPGLSSYNTSITNSSPTTTTVYKVTGTRGICSTTDTVRVTVNPDFSLDAGQNSEICVGDTVFLSATTDFKTYEWESADPTYTVKFSNSKVRDPYIYGLDKEITINLIAFDKNNCRKEDDLTIKVNELPILIAGADTFVCFGEQILLKEMQVIAEEPRSYRWLNDFALDDPTLARPTIKGVQAGIFYYPVELTDGNGCKEVDSIKVAVLERPTFEIFADKDTICEGQPVTLRGKGANSYEWFPKDKSLYPGGDSTGQKITVLPPVQPVQFRFYGNTFEPCGTDTTDAISVTVIELPTPTIKVVENGELKDLELEKACKGDSVVLRAEGAENYEWTELQDSSDEVVVRVLNEEPISFEVVGFSEGCRGFTDVISLVIDNADSCSSQLHVPNIFIPKGAQGDSNQYFFVKHYKIDDYDLKIFNRWGTLIHESTDINDVWDGTVNGVLVPQGVYYYVITAFGQDEEFRNKNGTLTIIYK